MARPDSPDAAQVVGEWIAGAHAISLLRAASDSNVLGLLANGRTVEELARDLGCEAEPALRLCQALEAHGVVERTGDAYRTRPGFLALDGDDRPMLLREQLAASRALQLGIERCLDTSPGFQSVDEDESLALALLAWGRPASEAAQRMWREADAQMPEVTAIWERGGTYAEFGCGAGRDLLRVPAMYSRVRAIGYDTLPHLLSVCRDQAELIGISDRVELIERDVRELTIEGAYDTLMWSQMFFGPGARSQVLDVIRRALVPGGYLLMPLMPDVPSPDDSAETPEMRALLIARVAYQRWRIQWEPSSVVRAELAASGFEEIRTIMNPRTPYLLYRKP